LAKSSWGPKSKRKRRQNRKEEEEEDDGQKQKTTERKEKKERKKERTHGKKTRARTSMHRRASESLVRSFARSC